MKAFILKHKKLSAFLSILLVLLVACSVSALSDYQARENVKAEFVVLEEHLVSETGIDPSRITTSEYCARSQTKSGPGAKYCSRGLSIEYRDITLSEAQEYFTTFKFAIEEQGDVVILRGLPESLEKKRERSRGVMGSAGYELFGRHCSTNYWFGPKDFSQARPITEDTPATLTMSFGCNDDSWFLRNVLNNTIY